MMRRAFTLIELLIVVAIIGILAAIAVPNFLNAQMRAKLAQVESNMKALSTATMAYYTDYGVFPLHEHVYNSHGLTTPVAYIASIPFDVFQLESYDPQVQTRLSRNKNTIHPEPFYTLSAGGAYGQPSLDKNIPAWDNRGLSLIWRFASDPALFEKARGQYPHGRYFVSLGPSREHQPWTFNVSNGLHSSGDFIRVAP